MKTLKQWLCLLFFAGHDFHPYRIEVTELGLAEPLARCRRCGKVEEMGRGKGMSKPTPESRAHRIVFDLEHLWARYKYDPETVDKEFLCVLIAKEIRNALNAESPSP